MPLSKDIEKELCGKDVSVFCGCDEAGRGPLAGPVFAAAVILPPDADIPGLDDSKKLSEKKREALFDVIKEAATDFSIAFATVLEIEQLNILNASMLAMHRAVEGLKVTPQLALVDGNVARGFSVPAVAVIKGDAKCPSIAAASVLAKVSRDRFCRELDGMYPLYGFSKHKGYGTKEHCDAILAHGPCPQHRISFLKKLLERESAK